MKEIFEKMSVYLESLERRQAAVEARVQQLVIERNTLAQRLADTEKRLAEAETHLQELQHRVDERPVMPVKEQQPVTEPLPEVKPQPEEEFQPIEESLPEIEPLPEIIEDVETAVEAEPDPIAEKIGEPEAESPVEVSFEPEQPIESAKEEKPVSRPRMVQTSLFGTPVQDIRQAISLGDRFLFQRELFGGNGERMQKTLDSLNILGSLREAEDYIAANFSWDKDNSTVEQFMNVLRRRFS